MGFQSFIAKIDKPVMKVFTIKTQHTNAFFSIRSEGGEKPVIIAFKHKASAKNFIKMQQSLTSGKKQGLKVDQIPMDSLARRCAINIIGLCVFDEHMHCATFQPMDQPDEHFIFNLENVVKYVD